jgi:hypothetical protein
MGWPPREGSPPWVQRRQQVVRLGLLAGRHGVHGRSVRCGWWASVTGADLHLSGVATRWAHWRRGLHDNVRPELRCLAAAQRKTSAYGDIYSPGDATGAYAAGIKNPVA